jgi:hypothetical protein
LGNNYKVYIMIDWIRPSGSTISTNDDERNIAAAKKLGWKRAKVAKQVPKQEPKKEPQQPLSGS